MADVCVVIPARNAAPTIVACLDGLLAQTATLDWEVIVVDDGSTDATAPIAASHALELRVIPGPAKGSYAARNAGVAATDARVLAFTDADCIPSPGWIEAGLAALDSEHKAAGGAIAWVTDIDTIPARYDRATYLQQEDSVKHQGFAATANLFVQRSVFDELGGFDAGLRSGGDYEFGQRMVRSGVRMAWAPGAIVAHHPRTTYRELWTLHRRLGAGWADLASRGLRPAWWREGALLYPNLGETVKSMSVAGEPTRRRQLVRAHLTVRGARVVGRLSHR